LIEGPILFVVGLPGTGKTSLRQSIARLPFQHISLGGTQICTDVASSRGFIVQVLQKASCIVPVILLDKVDKIGQSNLQGDPSTALLGVFDLEQNWSFNNDYINVPTYLSQVLFIYTANSLDTISSPLINGHCEQVLGN